MKGAFQHWTDGCGQKCGQKSCDKITLSQREVGVCCTTFKVCPKRVLLLCSIRGVSKGKTQYCPGEKKSKSYLYKNSQE